VLLKPILHGLVHSDTAASMIAKSAINYKDQGFTKVLLDLLSSFGGVDPRGYHRINGSPTLWDEMSLVRNKRNRVVHDAETASDSEATQAIAVATCIVDDLFPRVITTLGLHLHDLVVCDFPHGTDSEIRSGYFLTSMSGCRSVSSCR
jgi:hypothetical protein